MTNKINTQGIEQKVIEKLRILSNKDISKRDSLKKLEQSMDEIDLVTISSDIINEYTGLNILSLQQDELYQDIQKKVTKLFPISENSNNKNKYGSVKNLAEYLSKKIKQINQSKKTETN